MNSSSRHFCRDDEETALLLIFGRTDLRADLTDKCDHRGHAGGGRRGRQLDDQLQQRFTHDLAVDLNGVLL